MKRFCCNCAHWSTQWDRGSCAALADTDAHGGTLVTVCGDESFGAHVYTDAYFYCTLWRAAEVAGDR